MIPEETFRILFSAVIRRDMSGWEYAPAEYLIHEHSFRLGVADGLTIMADVDDADLLAQPRMSIQWEGPVILSTERFGEPPEVSAYTDGMSFSSYGFELRLNSRGVGLRRIALDVLTAASGPLLTKGDDVVLALYDGSVAGGKRRRTDVRLYPDAMDVLIRWLYFVEDSLEPIIREGITISEGLTIRMCPRSTPVDLGVDISYLDYEGWVDGYWDDDC